MTIRARVTARISRCRPFGDGVQRRLCGRRHDQGRHPAFASGHHGDLRNDAQGRHADADEEQNKKGGLLARSWKRSSSTRPRTGRLFAEKARELVSVDKVSAVFGCWTSVSRKSVLPVFEELNSILSIRSSTRARKAQRTSSIRAPLPISRLFPPSTI